MQENQNVPRIAMLAQAKAHGEAITAISAYDALTASLFDRAGIDIMLVGNIIGEEIYGLRSRVEVELGALERATHAVSLAARHALVVAGLPFGGYETGQTQALKSAIALMKAGADAITFEGGRSVADQVDACSSHGIPVIGHIGFTARSMAVPAQNINTREDAGEELVADAAALEEAGASALILDLVPSHTAERITTIVDIPTIGYGSGPKTSGQYMRWTDVAGISNRNLPYAPAFGRVGEELQASVQSYVDAVKSGQFPTAEHTA